MLEWILYLDKLIFTQINAVWTSAWLDSFFPFITDLHKTDFFKFFLVPTLFGVFMWRRGVKNGAIIFFFALLSISLADGTGNYGFKITVERGRPFSDPELHAIVRSPAGGYSFVSNHATNNFAFATFVSAFFPPARILLFAVATLVGYSRIYNGVHYPTDVICGAFIGMASAWLMILLCRKVLQKVNSHKEEGIA